MSTKKPNTKNKAAAARKARKKKKRIGLYNTFEEAFSIRKQKEKEIYGEFVYNHELYKEN